MAQIKKAEMTIKDMEEEIEMAKNNTILPEKLKEKYVKMMEGRIAERTKSKKLAVGGNLSYPKGRQKVKNVMEEFKEGKLKTSAGKEVTKKKQAVAIAISEQRSLEKEAGTIAKEHKELIEKEKAKRNKLKK